jgi:hypothetical protein
MQQSHGAAFAPLPSWHDDEGAPPSPTSHSHPHPYPPNAYGPLEPSSSYLSPPSAPAPANINTNYSHPVRYHPGYMAVPPKGGLTPVVEEDLRELREEQQQEQPPPQAPQGREIDDFSRAYSNAGIGQLPDEEVEEDRTPLRRRDNGQGASGSGSGPGDEDDMPTRDRGTHRPLWQQNRQQTRNLMWM